MKEGQDQTARLTSQFVTILTGAMLSQGFYDLWDKVDSFFPVLLEYLFACDFRGYGFPFLLLLLLLYIVVEHWRVLYAVHTDNNRLTLLLDLYGFALALRSMLHLNEAIEKLSQTRNSESGMFEVKALAHKPFIESLLDATTIICAFILLCLLRYFYTICFIKGNDFKFKNVKAQIIALIIGFFLAGFAASFLYLDLLKVAFVCSIGGLVVSVIYACRGYLSRWVNVNRAAARL